MKVIFTILIFVSSLSCFSQEICGIKLNTRADQEETFKSKFLGWPGTVCYKITKGVVSSIKFRFDNKGDNLYITEKELGQITGLITKKYGISFEGAVRMDSPPSCTAFKDGIFYDVDCSYTTDKNNRLKTTGNNLDLTNIVFTIY